MSRGRLYTREWDDFPRAEMHVLQRLTNELTLILIGIWFDDGKGLFYGEEEQDLFLSKLFRGWTMQLVDAYVLNGILSS